jgi:general secretion pathway protein F
MKSFRFRAANADDRPQSGMIEALDAAAAARLLIDRGLYPIELNAERRSWSEILHKPLNRALSSTDAAQVLVDLGHLLDAGVELAVALATMASVRNRRQVGEVLGQLLRDVRTGRSLSESMAGADVGFPAQVIAVIRAGEISGTLAGALMQAGTNLRQTAALRRKVRTALIYPTCVAVAVCLVILVLVGVVVPALETIFSQEVQRLPWQTRALVAVGRFVRQHAVAIVVLVASLGVAARLSIKYAAIRLAVERAIIRLPVIGSLVATAETARIASSLALLSASGLPLVQATTIARDCSRLRITQEAFSIAAAQLRQGASLHQALTQVVVLGPRVLALIRIGETTGRLSSLLTEAARDAEERVAASIERMLALMTPAMTLFFGGIAGFVLYAVMTAILSVNDLAGGAR